MVTVIQALVAKSGRTGLFEFFPSSEIVIAGVTSDPKVAHLPLTRTWGEADFSVASVMGVSEDTNDGQAVNLREWSMRLLSRYPYVLGKTFPDPSLAHVAD